MIIHLVDASEGKRGGIRLERWAPQLKLCPWYAPQSLLRIQCNKYFSLYGHELQWTQLRLLIIHVCPMHEKQVHDIDSSWDVHLNPSFMNQDRECTILI